MALTVFPRFARRFAVPSLVLATAGFCGFLAARAVADQPHMQAAADHLRAANRQLEMAEADKGGHRVKAIRLVNDALGQVEKGIQFERKN